MELADATRQEIERLQQEVTERLERLAALAKEAGPEPVEDHTLREVGGPVRLSELFGDHDDLIVIHNMGKGCPYCTLWADGFVGLLPHIENRTAFAIVSPDAPDVQQRFAEGRGWPFRMVSAEGSDFIEAMGFAGEKDGKRYVLPGYSTFRKQEDGSIVRVAYDHFGPGDPYCAVFHLFARLEGGAGDWQPRFTYDDPA